MNAWDATIVIVGLMLVFLGAWKGASRMLVDIATFGGAFLLACWFGGVVGGMLTFAISSQNWRNLVGFALIFLAVLVAGSLLKRLIVRALEVVRLRWFDRILGAGVGFLATALLFGLLLVPFVTWLPDSSNLISGSLLAPHTTLISRWCVSVVPAEIRQEFEKRLDTTEDAWKKRR